MLNFGNNNNNVPPPPSSRPPASEVASLSGNLTHVIVSPDHTDGIQVFLNGQPVLPGEVENVGINIVAPTSDSDSGTLTAILSRHQTNAGGERSQGTVSLFPGTVEVLAKGRRIQVHCPTEGSFEGLFLRIGNADGVGREVLGVQSLTLVLSNELISAQLVWADDGVKEDIFPN
jgi:hypothetical protein